MKNVMYLLYLIGFLSITSCQSGDNKNTTSETNSINPEVVNNPATAAGEKKEMSEKVPAFQFETETHEFGTIIQGENVTYAFRFKNAGNSDLVIQSATGSCGCTVPEYSKEAIAPGKDGIINVTFNSEGREGKQNKTITIVANTIPNTKVLTITGEVFKK